MFLDLSLRIGSMHNGELCCNALKSRYTVGQWLLKNWFIGAKGVLTYGDNLIFC